MTDQEQKLVDALISALTLSWNNNGNICADAARNVCVQAVAEVMRMTINEVLNLIEERAENLQ
jgi:hypothetical protein